MAAPQQRALTALPAPGELDTASRAELDHAMARLRDRGNLVVRLANAAGGALGRTMHFGSRTVGMLPGARSAVQGVTEGALRAAFDVAVTRLDTQGEAGRSKRLAGPLVLISGAVGGFIGMAGFVPDATVTSLAIMREIARIAQEAGESLNDPETRVACLQVFGLQAGGREDPEADLSYFSARMMLQGRPVAVLLGDVAGRFGLALSKKFALQAIPVIGAITGASLNAAFLKHFRDLAQAHFTVRRLERTFGAEAVRRAAA